MEKNGIREKLEKVVIQILKKHFLQKKAEAVIFHWQHARFIEWVAKRTVMTKLPDAMRKQ